MVINSNPYNKPPINDMICLLSVAVAELRVVRNGGVNGIVSIPFELQRNASYGQ